MTTIPSSYLVANDTWFAELILSDGQIRDPSINSSIIYIVQEPKLDSLNLAIPKSTTLDEGWYDLTLQSNHSQNLINSVTVIFNPTIQNSSAVQSFINSMSSQSFNILSHQNGLWTRQDYDFFSSTNRTIFASLIGNTIAITIQFTFIVKDKISGKSF